MFVKNAKETCGELKNRILYSLWRIPFFVFIMLVVKCGDFFFFFFNQFELWVQLWLVVGGSWFCVFVPCACCFCSLLFFVWAVSCSSYLGFCSWLWYLLFMQLPYFVLIKKKNKTKKSFIEFNVSINASQFHQFV